MELACLSTLAGLGIRLSRFLLESGEATLHREWTGSSFQSGLTSFFGVPPPPLNPFSPPFFFPLPYRASGYQAGASLALLGNGIGLPKAVGPLG